jgi:F-type H+-transporting ATPase subunit b
VNTVVVTHLGASGFSVSFPRETTGDEHSTSGETTAHGEESLDEGPSPIAPEVKELLWGLGAFLTLLVLMRFVMFPKLKRGMDARYASIRGGHESADAVRAAATADVAEYQAALAGVRAEAAQRIDAARGELEALRSARLAEVNARIADKRAAAAAEADAVRAAAQGQIEAAVADVASLTAELTVGRAPDSAAVRSAVASVIGGGA